MEILLALILIVLVLIFIAIAWKLFLVLGIVVFILYLLFDNSESFNKSKEKISEKTKITEKKVMSGAYKKHKNKQEGKAKPEDHITRKNKQLGERTFKKLQEYCPKCYPITWGTLSPEPRLLLVVPFSFWVKLSTREKYALAEYMDFLIKDVKKHPEKYFNEEVKKLCKENPTATVCSLQKWGGTFVKGWEIALGVYYGSKLFVNETVVCSKTVEKCHGLHYPDIKKYEKKHKTDERARLFFDNNFTQEKREKWIRYYRKNGIL